MFKSKVDKILEKDIGSTLHSYLVVTNHPIYGLPKGYTPLEETLVQSRPLHIYVTSDGFTVQGKHVAQASHIPPPSTDEELQYEYEVQSYHDPITAVNVVDQHDSKAVQMCRALAERLKAINVKDKHGMDTLEMCSVPDVVLPPKLKYLTLTSIKDLASL